MRARAGVYVPVCARDRAHVRCGACMRVHVQERQRDETGGREEAQAALRRANLSFMLQLMLQCCTAQHRIAATAIGREKSKAAATGSVERRVQAERRAQTFDTTAMTTSTATGRTSMTSALDTASLIAIRRACDHTSVASHLD